MIGTITVQAIDAMNQDCVFSFPKTARSRVVIYSPARIMMPISARIRFALFCIIYRSLYSVIRKSIVDDWFYCQAIGRSWSGCR